MNTLTSLHFFSFLIYFYLMGFVLNKNPKNLLNRVCALLILCFAIWSFGTGFHQNVYTSKDMVKLTMNINCIGWCSLASFGLCFFLVFTKKEKILKKKITYFLIFFPAVLFIYKQWKGSLISDFIREPYGWSYKWSESIWPNLFYIYYFSFILLGLYLCFNFGRKTKFLREKKQADIIFTTTFISLILGSISNVLVQELNIHNLPSMGDVFALVWAGGVVYAITKYGLMTITPLEATNNILATMSNSLILIEPEGEIIAVNEATLNLLGYKKEKLIGKPIINIFVEAEFLFNNEKFKELTQKGGFIDYYAFYRSSSGHEIPVSVSVSIMKDNCGEVVGIVCVAKDMREINRLMQREKELAATAATAAAEKKRTEELERANRELDDAIKELRNTQTQLIQEGKMAAVGRLGAGVAHELNNPLGGILGYAQFILEKFKRPDFGIEDFKACQRYIESIERESIRCKKIVENLLKFSRKPLFTKLESLDIGKAIEEAISIVGYQLKLNNIKVITDIKPNLVKVTGLVSQLQQVFTNLIFNAQQAMPNGGQLKIKAENIIDKGIQKPKHIRIEFTDTGCGIPEKDLSKIFEPFFTTMAKEKGIGVGLPISYQIIQDHKGTIDVTSEVDKGTTFTITLPAAEK